MFMSLLGKLAMSRFKLRLDIKTGSIKLFYWRVKR